MDIGPGLAAMTAVRVPIAFAVLLDVDGVEVLRASVVSGLAELTMPSDTKAGWVAFLVADGTEIYRVAPETYWRRLSWQGGRQYAPLRMGDSIRMSRVDEIRFGSA